MVSLAQNLAHNLDDVCHKGSYQHKRHSSKVVEEAEGQKLWIVSLSW